MRFLEVNRIHSLWGKWSKLVMALTPLVLSPLSATSSLHQDSSAGHVRTMVTHAGEHLWCTRELWLWGTGSMWALTFSTSVSERGLNWNSSRIIPMSAVWALKTSNLLEISNTNPIRDYQANTVLFYKASFSRFVQQNMISFLRAYI